MKNSDPQFYELLWSCCLRLLLLLESVEGMTDVAKVAENIEALILGLVVVLALEADAPLVVAVVVMAL